MRRPIKTMAKKKWVLQSIRCFLAQSKEECKKCPVDEEHCCNRYRMAPLCQKLFPEVKKTFCLGNPKCPCSLLGRPTVTKIVKEVLNASIH